MNAVSGTLSAASCARRAKRDRVLLAARILTRAGETNAQLSDISSGGCCVYCAAPLAVGDLVTLARGHIVLRARVAWIRAGRTGLQFSRPVDVAALQAGRPSAG